MKKRRRRHQRPLTTSQHIAECGNVGFAIGAIIGWPALKAAAIKRTVQELTTAGLEELEQVPAAQRRRALLTMLQETARTARHYTELEKRHQQEKRAASTTRSPGRRGRPASGG